MYPLPEQYNKGFTIIEALVALVVLTVSLGPALILSSNLSSTISVVQNNLIATGLAQEGVEVVRALRDANWFNNLPFDNGLSDGTYRVEWDSGSLIILGANPPLKIDNGRYNYSSGADTLFQRTITITKLSPENLRVVSNLTWNEKGGRARDIKVESYLFNWK